MILKAKELKLMAIWLDKTGYI